MISPIDLIRTGITQGQWQSVCDGFAKLTGEKIPPPAAAFKVPTGGFPKQYYETLGRSVLAVVRDCPPDGLVCGKLTPADLGIDVQKEAVAITKERHREQEKAEGDSEDLFEDEPDQGALAVPTQAAKPTDDLEQFRIKHAGPSQNADTEGKRPCRASEVVPGNFLEWSDDGSLVPEELEESKEMSKTKTPAPRRAATKKVKVECCKCGGKDTVDPLFGPRGYEKGGEKSLYVCPKCTGTNKPIIQGA